MRVATITLLLGVALISACSAIPATPAPQSTAPATALVPTKGAEATATPPPFATAAASATAAPARPSDTPTPAATVTSATAAVSSERQQVVSFVGTMTKLENEYDALLEQIADWERCCQQEAPFAEQMEKRQGFLDKRRDLARRMAEIPIPTAQDGRLAWELFDSAYRLAAVAEKAYLEFVEFGDVSRLAEATAAIDAYVVDIRQARDALAGLIEKMGITPQEAGVERFP